MARIGLEYMETFANARAQGYDAPDLISPYYIGEWFIGNLRDAGHQITVARRNGNAAERGLRDTSKSGDDAKVADSVDLYLILTHGHYDGAGKRALLLYDTQADDWIGHSGNWILGDTCNLEWLMLFGCWTVLRDRLLDHLHVFKGLHLLCGAYGNMWDSWTTQECGNDISNYLICGKPVADAWLEGASDWWCANHPIVVSVERAEQWVNGDADWPNTVLCTDHLWGQGTTRADVLPPDQFMMVCKWSEQGIWD